jgi:hypothetical protein
MDANDLKILKILQADARRRTPRSHAPGDGVPILSGSASSRSAA